MSHLRRRSRPIFALLAFAALALVLGACSSYKSGSLQLSQPSGIGSVRVHFEICTDPLPSDEGGPVTCRPNQEISTEQPKQSQGIIGIAAPKGATAPATITGTPLRGGPPIVFTRNDQAAQSIAESTAASEKPWPPTGLEGFGYLSAPIDEEIGVLREWSFDAEFGRPAAAAGESFAPFPTAIAFGTRGVGGKYGAPDRPVKCYASLIGAPEDGAFCETIESAQIGTSDLRVGVAPQSAAFRGGKAALAFPLEFASTASQQPSFNLAASSTLPGATVALSSPTFTPGSPDGGTHRSPIEARTVTVAVPKGAAPGVYDVTLTVSSALGGYVSQVQTVSQVAKVEVKVAKIKLGKVKLNKAKGTATVFVGVPAAGTLTVSGKGIAKAKRSTKAARTVKLPLKARGKAKSLLSEDGKAQVRAKVTFRPTGAAPVAESRGIVLKKSPGPGAR